MLLALVFLACGSPEPDPDAVFDACFAAIDAACYCWIEAAGWSDQPRGQHLACIENKLAHCDDGSWTIEEVDVFVTTMECTPTT